MTRTSDPTETSADQFAGSASNAASEISPGRYGAVEDLAGMNHEARRMAGGAALEDHREVPAKAAILSALHPLESSKDENAKQMKP